MTKLFEVSVRSYDETHDFSVCRPASLDMPRDNSVMFVTESHIERAGSLDTVSNCLVFWPAGFPVPGSVKTKHAVVLTDDPRLEYCKFYRNERIASHPLATEGRIVNGAFIANDATIGENATILPFAYIDGQVEIGNDVIIGSGARLIGKVKIGNDVVIRENAVIGTDGLSTDRDENGHAATMPQFGGVVLASGVRIGANTVIARGAIDDTEIGEGCKIDNCCFISHNVKMGPHTFVVGESIMFGSSTTGEQAYISGNATVREGIHVGRKSIVAMGAVVTKAVPDGVLVLGNPAKPRSTGKP
jgi:UDP-3-O-[3-hydroxymyristoyl] glucosamine N-acyltransferase LpxD